MTGSVDCPLCGRNVLINGSGRLRTHSAKMTRDRTPDGQVVHAPRCSGSGMLPPELGDELTAANAGSTS